MNKTKRHFIAAIIVLVVLAIGAIILLDNSGGQLRSNEVIVDDRLISMVEILEDEAVYVTLSNEERIRIADFVTFKNENFTEVRNYQSYEISPNKQFVAIDGYAFEDGIVEVYDADTDILHEVIYGQADGWADDGLLLIETCDLSGDSCVGKISLSADTPWVVQEIPGSATGPGYE